MSEEELYHLAQGKDVRMYAFLSALKTYDLLYEFCTEVLRNKYLSFDDTLLESDWSDFIASKKNLSSLANRSKSTLQKAKQVIYGMLTGVGLIEGKRERRIVRPYLSEEFLQTLCHDDPKWLVAFLLSEADIIDICKK